MIKLKESLNSAEPQSSSSHPLFNRSRFKYLPLTVLLLLVANLLGMCHSSFSARQAAKDEPYVYVQLPDGEVVQAQPKGHLYRSEETLQQFAQNWLTLGFSWKLDPAPEANPENMVTERNINFPKPFHAASVAIIPGLRESYMDSTAQKYRETFPFEKYISGEQQSYLRFFEEPKVHKIKDGVWDITVIATRTHASGNAIIAHEIFNHVLRVQAIKPTASQGELWAEMDTPLGKLLNATQRQGLQIIEINEI